MVMSQGTYTFLTCFGGFWLVWAFVVLLCCFCNSLQRRLKRRRERRLRRRILDTPPTGEPTPQSSAPPPTPQGSWTAPPDLVGKPPSYEDAVLMEDPPPPYSAILADAHRGTHPDPKGRTAREPESSETSKTAPDGMLSERAGWGYSSVIHLATATHCDSQSPLLSTLELNCNNLPSAGLVPGTTHNPALIPGTTHNPALITRTTPNDLRLGPPLLDRNYALPTAFPVFGRSTAV